MESPESRWDRLGELWELASRLPPDSRTAFLTSHCVDDPALRAQLEELLAHGSPPGEFLAEPHPLLATALAESAESFAPGLILAGRFEIVRLIGLGGMGEVYEAFDRELSVSVALKTIRRDLASPEMLDRFKAEIQLARRITHPNVCRIFDIARDGASPGLHFLTMELLAGEALSTRLSRERLGRALALNIAQQILNGLCAAHDLGIVHRDIKPSNIMLVPLPDSSLRAVLMDFGLAYSLPSPELPSTQPLPLAGSPYYMAPEQFQGGVITPATDVYALGVLLHELLTGRRPEGTASITQFLQWIGQPKARRSIPPLNGLDARTARIILRCLQPNPALRYQTCRDLVNDLFAPHLLRRKTTLLALGATASLGVLFWTNRRPPNGAPRSSHIPAANTNYQKGRLHLRRLTTDDLKKAIGYFDQAIQIDNRFSLAHSGRADAFSILTDYGGISQREAASAALASARKAVEFGPELAEAHASLGLALSNNLPLWRSAEPPFRRALELDPAYAYTYHWYGTHLARLDRRAEATSHLAKALAADPVSLPTSATYGFTLYFARRYADAIEQGLRTIDLDPNFRYGYLLLARSYTESGQLQAALTTCGKGIQLSGNAPVFASAWACIQIAMGNRSAALKVLADLEAKHQAEHIPALYIASLHARLGNQDETIRWLRLGWDAWESSILLIRVYPHFDSLRTDPAFLQVLRDFHLLDEQPR